MSVKQFLTHNLLNIPGWHTKRHIVVFESDDWGSVRMPSLETFDYLNNHGVSISDKYGYDTNDTLASNDDLELLADALLSVKDSKGNPAKITFNCCVANPDFEKIKESNFQQYFYEPFTETLKRYPNHDRSFELWKEGIRHKVFQPQFHGREHLNVPMWLRLLQSNVGYVRKAFDKGVFSMDVVERGLPQNVLHAYDVLQKEDYDFVCQSVREGLDLFERLFGFRSLSMIAPCYTWDKEIEDVALRGGVRFFQGGHVQIASVYAKSQGLKSIRHFTGRKNTNGQFYMIRTCSFEPTQCPGDNAVSCMKEIEMDFRSHKPAIVSCHRFNFIGGLQQSNRDNNLREFKKLLQMIVTKYPDVEFMSSDELGLLLNE